MHGVARGSGQANRLIKVKLSFTFTADDQVAVIAGNMLAWVVIPASITIKAPFGAPRSFSMASRVPASATMPAKVCELRTKPLLSSTRPVSPMGNLYAFFRPPTVRLAVILHFAFKVGVDQIIQRHSGGKPKNIADAVKQTLFDNRMVFS